MLRTCVSPIQMEIIYNTGHFPQIDDAAPTSAQARMHAGWCLQRAYQLAYRINPTPLWVNRSGLARLPYMRKKRHLIRQPLYQDWVRRRLGSAGDKEAWAKFQQFHSDTQTHDQRNATIRVQSSPPKALGDHPVI